MYIESVKLFWVSHDKQGDFPMGDFPTEEAARAAIPEAQKDLLEQCTDEDCREEILRGTWTLEKGLIL